MAKPKKNKGYMGNDNLPTKGTTYDWTPEMINELSKCKTDIMHFAQNHFYILNVDEGKQKIKLYDAQKRVLEKMMNHRFFVLLASRQIGKPLAITTPIKTETGWLTMNDIIVGDRVYGVDGELCNVTHVHDIKYNQDCYEIEFDNGEKIIADGDHNWFTITDNNSGVKSTLDIYNSIDLNHKIPVCINSITASNHKSNPNIDKLNASEFILECGEMYPPVDPYTLGLWVGDVDSIDSRIYTGPSREHVYLRNMSYYGYIPHDFLNGSRKTRLKLLKGLMDVNGYIDPSGKAYFYSKNDELISQIKELIEGLGYKVIKSSSKSEYGDENSLIWKLSFIPRENICTHRDQIKRIKINDHTEDDLYHHIKKITPVNSVPVRCISVDSPDNLFLVGKSLIPTHNSTLMTIYVLWLANFFSDQKILLVANKEATAIEIFQRVRMAYELLPNWLKSPVDGAYGKTSMELENGSKISISTTTGTAARGQSISCLILDEVAFIECISKHSVITIRHKISENIEILTIDDLCSKLLELNDERIISDPELGFSDLIEIIPNNTYDIYTPSGWKDFKGISKYTERRLLKITTESGKTIEAAGNHAFVHSGENIIAKDVLNQYIDTIDGSEKVISIEESIIDYVYDVIEVEDCHNFYANGIVNHNTHLVKEFWASVFPIVSSSKKAKVFMCSTANGTGNLFHEIYSGAERGDNNWGCDKIIWHEVPGRDEAWADDIKKGLVSKEMWDQEFNCQFINSGTTSLNEEVYDYLVPYCKEPIETLKDGCYKIFEMPSSDKIYVAGVDTAEGLGGDFSCIKIIDITDLSEIKEVAEYYNNRVPVAEFSNVVHEILQHWGNPLVCIERNNQGGQVADRLGIDFAYEKVVCWGSALAHRKNQTLLGMISSRNTKIRAVANAKYFYAEKRSVFFANKDSLVELFKDFQKMPNDTWSAVSGKHDDRTMALIWALMVLDKDICEQYFNIDEYDECGKPKRISPLDLGISMFSNPTSIYTNEEVENIIASNLSPISFGSMHASENSEITNMLGEGWTYLGNSHYDDNNQDISYDQWDLINKYF